MCFFQAEDGIRDLVRSRGLGDVYKRQILLRVDLSNKSSWITEMLDSRDLGALNRSGSLTQHTTSCPESIKTGSSRFPIYPLDPVSSTFIC